VPKCNYVMFRYSKIYFGVKVISGFLQFQFGFGFTVQYGRRVLLFRKKLLFACLSLLHTGESFKICVPL